VLLYFGPMKIIVASKYLYNVITGSWETIVYWVWVVKFSMSGKP